MTIPYLPPMIPSIEAHSSMPRMVVEPQRRSNLPVGLLGLGTLAAGIYDAESTFAGLKGGREANPIMAPFVNAGRVPTYAMLAALTAGQTVASKFLRDHGVGWWWVPQGLTAAGHVVAGLLNQRFNE